MNEAIICESDAYMLLVGRLLCCEMRVRDVMGEKVCTAERENATLLVNVDELQEETVTQELEVIDTV